MYSSLVIRTGILTSLLVVISLMAPVAKAEPAPALVNSLRAQIGAVTRALAESEIRFKDSPSVCELGSAPLQAQEGWYFRSFWLRLRGDIGFEVPGFAKVTVVPETELLLQRELPDGWETYKP